MMMMTIFFNFSFSSFPFSPLLLISCPSYPSTSSSGEAQSIQAVSAGHVFAIIILCAVVWCYVVFLCCVLVWCCGLVWCCELVWCRGLVWCCG